MGVGRNCGGTGARTRSPRVAGDVKPSLTERQATMEFCAQSLRTAKTAWPDTYKTFRDTVGRGFIVEDEPTATFDFALAGIALDSQAVWKLFPKEQADRIERLIFKCFESTEWEAYAIHELKEYGDIFQREVDNISNDGDPVNAIPIRLLHRLLGDRIRTFYVEMSGTETRYISPVLALMAQDALTPFVGTWKALRDRFDLLE